MTNRIDRFLQDINDIGFRQLELRLQIGRMLRDAEIHYELTMAQMTKNGIIISMASPTPQI